MRGIFRLANMGTRQMRPFEGQLLLSAGDINALSPQFGPERKPATSSVGRLFFLINHR
jgi:hypothetical protein